MQRRTGTGGGKDGEGAGSLEVQQSSERGRDICCQQTYVYKPAAMKNISRSPTRESLCRDESYPEIPLLGRQNAEHPRECSVSGDLKKKTFTRRT